MSKEIDTDTIREILDQICKIENYLNKLKLEIVNLLFVETKEEEVGER